MNPKSSSPSPGSASAPAGVDLTKVCQILAGQIERLDSLFQQSHELAIQEEGGTEAYERLARLALRSQSQSARTGSVLGRLCQVHALAMADHSCQPAMRPPVEYQITLDPAQDPYRYPPTYVVPPSPPVMETKTVTITVSPDSPLDDLIVTSGIAPYYARCVNQVLSDDAPWPDGVVASIREGLQRLAQQPPPMEALAGSQMEG